jgi:uncharacterized protein YjbI with pentapeptide repeats
MAGQVDVDWPTCDEDGCIGIRLDAGDKCLAHAGDEEQDAALGQVARTGNIDARGVTISSPLLKKILDSTSRSPDGDAMLAEVQFTGATFQGYAEFIGANLGGAWFVGATFQGSAEFAGATFQSAFFAGATFQGGVGFGGATFQDYAGFSGATFQGYTVFSKAGFRGGAWFSGATFQDHAEFSEATFQGDARFDGATFQGDARFDEATFERAQQFGPLLAHRGLSLDAARFIQPVRIEASTIGMCCRQAQFPGGVQFRLRWARVVLDNTDIPAPSLLTGIRRLANETLALAEQQIASGWEQEHADHISEQPKLLSLQGANVAGLGLANVDLAGCRFSGAHNLDGLRLDADVAFKASPAQVGWEQRQVIAEECTWRASRTRRGPWADPWWPDEADLWCPRDLEKPSALPPGTIAGLYRALRKGREDAKDEPDAADFYYGEMEMRRHADGWVAHGDGGSRGPVDRGVLTAYWLVSGYGLRAWRALAWFAGITVSFAFAYHLIGFSRPPQPATYWTSLLYAFRSTISLTDDEVTLTAWGELLQALLRLTGPVLLGLALLALRGRIKR